MNPNRKPNGKTIGGWARGNRTLQLRGKSVHTVMCVLELFGNYLQRLTVTTKQQPPEKRTSSVYIVTHLYKKINGEFHGKS